MANAIKKLKITEEPFFFPSAQIFVRDWPKNAVKSWQHRSSLLDSLGLGVVVSLEKQYKN
jgi:hypothetical protein